MYLINEQRVYNCYSNYLYVLKANVSFVIILNTEVATYMDTCMKVFTASVRTLCQSRRYNYDNDNCKTHASFSFP